MSEVKRKYWAFISYSSKDEAVARRLHRALEHYPVPRNLVGRPSRDGTPLPRRLFPVFRDRDELALSADLGEAIQAALRATHCLIVLCSPASAASRWVNEEVRYFKSIGGEARILAVIVSGQPNAADHGAPAGEECFPPTLRCRADDDGGLTDECHEPVGGDLRPGGDGWNGCLLKAVAGITGMDLAAFTKRDRIRRRRRRLWAAAAVLLALVGLTGWWDYTRTKVTFHPFVTEYFGVPKGVGSVGLGDRLNGISSYRIESSRGKIRRVVRLNGSGFPAPDEDSPLRESIRRYFYRENGSLQRVELLAPDELVLGRLNFSEMSGSPGGKELFVELESVHRGAPLSVDALGQQPDARSEISAWRHEYDEDGLLRQKSNLNAYRSVVADRSGAGGERMRYDARGLPVETVFLDVAMQPRPRKDGVESIRLGRDDLGRVIAKSYHGARGQPVAGPDGVHRVRYTFGGSGHQDYEHYFDTSDLPTPHRLGHAGLRLVRDKRGNVTETAFFAADGKLLLKFGDILLERGKFDERGNKIETYFLGRDFKPARVPGGYDTIKCEYDDGRRLVRQSYFADGQPVVSSRDGYASLEVAYDHRGNFVSAACLGAAGEAVVGHNDYSVVRFAYDDRGNRTEVAYLGADGRPIMLPEGYASQKFAHDKMGNVVEITHYGADGRPISGASTLRLQRDERGNVIEESSHDRSGRLVSENGYAAVKTQYDSSGRKIKESYFDADGKPVATAKGYSVIRYFHDAQGNVVDMQFDSSGGEDAEGGSRTEDRRSAGGEK